VKAYALACGGLLLLGGRAGDRSAGAGRNVSFVGMLLFSAASLAGGFATTAAWCWRTGHVQGDGAAIVAPQRGDSPDGVEGENQPKEEVKERITEPKTGAMGRCFDAARAVAGARPG